jgi:tetratricopeptide (TPR) repeat protein
LPGGFCGIDEDRPGRIVAKAYQASAYVLAAGRTIAFGPMDDVRSVAVSPDGEWLAAGSHQRGAAVWRIRDRTRVVDLPTESGTRVLFSPDGRWLMTRHPTCALWAVGTWQLGRTIGGSGMTFSPDGRQLIVQDSSKILRLVETETGRTLARLESPDLCLVEGGAFSPDGSRLVMTTNDGPAVHVWDLRAIRRHLAPMGLDWDAPAYSDDDSAGPSAPPLPPLQVDLGALAGHVEHFTEPSEALLRRYTARLKEAPDDAEAYHHRAHALADLNRLEDAAGDVSQVIRLRPDDAHARVFRARIHLTFARYQPAISDLEAALAVKPDELVIREMLAYGCNNLAWELANAAGPRRELDRALTLVRRALAVAPNPESLLNTLGVVQYRTGRYAEAVATLERSLAAGGGQFDGFDLLFLTMAHHRLGQADQARACHDRAVRWIGGRETLEARAAKELAAFRAEAEAVLAGPAGELPDDVFAHRR